MCLLVTLIDMTQVIMLCVVLVPPQPEGMVFISPADFCSCKFQMEADHWLETECFKLGLKLGE